MIFPLLSPAWLEKVSPSAQPQTGEVDLSPRIKALHAQGLSLNEIQRQVFGYVGGKAYETVRKALEGNTTTTDNRYEEEIR